MLIWAEMSTPKMSIRKGGGGGVKVEKHCFKEYAKKKSVNSRTGSQPTAYLYVQTQSTKPVLRTSSTHAAVRNDHRHEYNTQGAVRRLQQVTTRALAEETTLCMSSASADCIHGTRSPREQTGLVRFATPYIAVSSPVKPSTSAFVT